MKNFQIQPDPFLEIARRVLPAYGLERCRLEFIQHSDTVTYKVVDSPDGQVYLLRLHVPVTTAMGSHGENLDALRSELVWLEALKRDTDLILQQPVRSQAGELVYTLFDDQFSKPVHATMLTWLEGDPYRRELENKDMARQMGVILAKLHLQASHWHPPEWFSRPYRDAAYFESMLQGLRPLVMAGRVRPADFTELEHSIRILQSSMCSLGNDPQRCGIMHADAHKGNLLIQNGQVRLIDFSFCAIGDYLFDLSIALGDLRPELHADFWAGYKSLRTPPHDYQPLVEAFFVGMMVGHFYYLASKPETQAILNRRVPQIAQEYAARLNRGESFWFSE